MRSLSAGAGHRLVGVPLKRPRGPGHQKLVTVRDIGSLRSSIIHVAVHFQFHRLCDSMGRSGIRSGGSEFFDGIGEREEPESRRVWDEPHCERGMATDVADDLAASLSRQVEGDQQRAGRDGFAVGDCQFPGARFAPAAGYRVS